MSEFEFIEGNLVDLYARKIYPARITWLKGIITELKPVSGTREGFIIPGLVDSHIHIESSMLTPQHFAEVALRHGTVATVSDPHEIANVLGMDGVRFMVDNAKQAPLKFYFGAPSCVPATPFETSGARISAEEIKVLFDELDLKFLSEMMNFPGVVNRDPEVMRKLQVAREYNKPVDGHAPGLSGEALRKYAEAGIQTDHECFSYQEAVEKIQNGMIVQIREGSAARNFENLWKLIDQYPEKVMLCSDDLHPDALMKGHINLLLKRAVEKGADIFNLLKTVNHNPVDHYKLNVGKLRVGDPADFTIVDDLENFNVRATFIEGTRIFDGKTLNYQAGKQQTPNKFRINDPEIHQFAVKDKGKKVKVIKAIDGELITEKLSVQLNSTEGYLLADPGEDILKIIVQNRYEKEEPAVGFIKGFGLTKGAVGSSIAHDSHNIIIAGTDDKYLAEVLSWINENQGGIAFHDGQKIHGLPLKVAGIISEFNAAETANLYANLDREVKNAGCRLQAPFMTLSFMALQVIPELKIGNKGLFDVNKFEFTSLYDE